MSFIYCNLNPRDKFVGDCTVRAIALLLDKSWKSVYSGLVAIGFLECDMPASNSIWSKYLLNYGCIRKVAPNTCPYCYTVKDFCIDNPIGRYLLSTGSHVVTVIDGNYYDTWDSGDQVIIHYWFKGED